MRDDGDEGAGNGRGRRYPEQPRNAMRDDSGGQNGRDRRRGRFKPPARNPAREPVTFWTGHYSDGEMD